MTKLFTRTRHAIGIALFVAVGVAAVGCHGSNPTAPSSPQAPSTPAAPTPTGVGLSVLGLAIDTSISINVGQSIQVSASATMSDGSRTDVTNTSTWTSDSSAVASVSSSGLITGKSAGDATITSNYSNIIARLHVSVKGGSSGGSGAPGNSGGPTVSGLSISGTATVLVGASSQLTVTAAMSDGSQQNVTSQASWTSGAPQIATVSAGLVRGVAPGTATLQVGFSGASAQIPVQVQAAPGGGGGGTGGGGNGGGGNGGGGSGGNPPSVQNLVVGGSMNLTAGGTSQLTAIASLSDGSQQNVTAQATWASSAPQVATVSAGLVHGVAAGSATIQVAYGGSNAQVKVKVDAGSTPPTVESVAIGGTLALNVGDNSQLTATANLSDGTQQIVTGQATWTSSASPIASVAGGLVKGVAAGSATVQASYGGATAQVTIQVKAGGGGPVTPTVVGLSVTGNLSLLPGASTQLTATAAMSDGTNVNVTALANWSSNNPLLATVSAGGNVTALLAGLCGITASYQGVSAQVQVQINAVVPSLVSVSVTGPATVKVLHPAQLQAIAHFSDGSTQDVTSQATWTSSSSLLGSLIGGLLNALLPGNLIATATYKGLAGQLTIVITL